MVEVDSPDLRNLATKILLERLEVVFIKVLKELSQDDEVLFVISPPMLEKSFMRCEQRQLDETVKDPVDLLFEVGELVEHELFSRFTALDEPVKDPYFLDEVVVEPERPVNLSRFDVHLHIFKRLTEVPHEFFKILRLLYARSEPLQYLVGIALHVVSLGGFVHDFIRLDSAVFELHQEVRSLEFYLQSLL